MNRKIIMSPSVLATDMMNVGVDIKRAVEAGADVLHCDVMDGVYVPNISFGFEFIKSISRITDLPLDVHMMTVCPDKYIDVLKAAGAKSVTVHHDFAEKERVIAALKAIREAGMIPAISLRPAFGAEELEDFEGLFDSVLVMTVEPGFGGQKFMSDMLPKIEKIRNMYPDTDIQVDGGIAEATIGLCAKAGANNFVVGTSSFKAPDMKKALDTMRANALAGCEVM